MNKQQRKEIAGIEASLQEAVANLRAIDLPDVLVVLTENMQDGLELVISNLEACKDQIVNIGEEEQEKFDNLTEGLQQTERGQAYADNASMLSDIEDEIQGIIDDIEALVAAKEASSDDVESVADLIEQVSIDPS